MNKMSKCTTNVNIIHNIHMQPFWPNNIHRTIGAKKILTNKKAYKKDN